MTNTTTHTKTSSQPSLPRNRHCERSEAISLKEAKSLTPKLRFKEFEGEWEQKKLGEIAERIGDGLHGTPKYVEESDIFFINGNNLINGRITLTSKTKKVDKSTFLKNDKKLGLNTLLISLNGTIGNISRFNNEKVMLGKSVGYFNFKNNSNFHYHILTSPKIQQFFISELTGSTIKNLSLTTLRKTKINLPNLPEQQKISNFLTAVDTKLQQLTTKKETLALYKKGVMQQLFSQQLRFKPDVTNDTVIANAVKQSQEATSSSETEFPEWEEKRLGEVVTRIGDGIHSTPKYDENGKYFFINGNNLTKGKIIINESTKKVNKSEFEKHKRDLDQNTILLSINGTIGNIAFYDDEDIVLGKSACYINLKNSIDLYFTYYLLQSSSIQNYFYSELTGSTIKNLSLKTIRETKLKLPCFEEQQKIANYLSAIDIKIEAVQTQIMQTQAFKKGLLQQMFV
ncbi:restriction endonuclease subunit S [Olleya sp. ITB9]|uniref:restriction endonuclease subunit S n=1 Tax=Olleya sp. ITB9 TaxID=1715648 RepID=UPI0006D0E452|nr:restriction endonuclease subunit S [Olleya sp. ITB9]